MDECSAQLEETSTISLKDSEPHPKALLIKRKRNTGHTHGEKEKRNVEDGF